MQSNAVIWINRIVIAITSIHCMQISLFNNSKYFFSSFTRRGTLPWQFQFYSCCQTLQLKKVKHLILQSISMSVFQLSSSVSISQYFLHEESFCFLANNNLYETITLKKEIWWLGRCLLSLTVMSPLLF